MYTKIIRSTRYTIDHAQGQLTFMVFCLTGLRNHLNWSNRRIQERDKQRLDRVQPEEQLQWPKNIQEDEKQKREEITKKNENEEKGKQEMQEKLSKLFQPHQEPIKPAVQAPWSNAGRGKKWRNAVAHAS